MHKDNRLADRPETDVFCGLTGEQLRAIKADLKEYHLCEGQLWGDSAWSSATIFLLMEGRVKLFIEVERGPAVFDFVEPGQILDFATRCGTPNSLQAVTIEPCRFSVMDYTLWQQHLMETPQLGLNLLQISAAYLQHSLFHSQMLREVSVRGRLAHLLLHYEQRFGVPSSCGDTAGVALPFALSQRELAATIGASREGLQKCLAEFRKRRVISIDDAYRITIHDCAALQKLCAFNFLPIDST